MNRRTYPTIIFSVFLLMTVLVAAPSPAVDQIEVVRSETGFYYTIQKGDTLWDLSKQFNDSPWLWPELWEGNDQITNPHWIFPGERIRLYKKSGSQTITKSEPIQPVAVAAVEPEVEKKAAAPYFVYSSINSVGFIRKPPVPAVGKIFEVQGVKVLISEGDVVYIRPADDVDPSVLIPGSRHTVFRYMPPTDARDSIETIGTQHYILGIVEVTKKEAEMVIARVLKSFRTIRANDLLMPFNRRHHKIMLKPSTPGMDGKIITSEDHSKLTGDYTLAFIDKGRVDNIEVGQQYSIYGQQKLVLENSGISARQLPPVDFGTLLVLHTEQTTSTVVITSAAKTISAGERFRTPKR